MISSLIARKTYSESSEQEEISCVYSCISFLMTQLQCSKASSGNPDEEAALGTPGNLVASAYNTTIKAEKDGASVSVLLVNLSYVA